MCTIENSMQLRKTFSFAHALLMTSRRSWHLKTFNLKNAQALVFITLFKTFGGFPWLSNSSLNLLAWPFRLSISWGLTLGFFSSPLGSCHQRQNALCIEIPFPPMSHEPLSHLFLENLHSLHFSSHLFPFEIPPKPIKHYITLHSSQTIWFNTISPSFPPRALTLATTYLHLADGAWNCYLYHFVFALSS